MSSIAEVRSFLIWIYGQDLSGDIQVWYSRTERKATVVLRSEISQGPTEAPASSSGDSGRGWVDLISEQEAKGLLLVRISVTVYYYRLNS